MPNSILTPTQITREALRVLHGQLSFIGGTNRQYDDSFAKTGAKIGTSLNVRMPPKYTVRTGATLTAQDHVERSTPLRVSSQYGVDVSFTTVEMTMSLDDFSDRVIKPAMAQLAAKIEADALSVAYKSIANYVGTTSTQIDYKRFASMGRVLTENLAPSSDRVAVLSPNSRVEFADAVKGLFQASQNISQQYREGIIGRTGGFDVYENTFLPSHQRGTLAGSALTKGATLGVTTTNTNSWAATTELVIDGATSGTTLKAGDIITISGVYDVHPETKVSTGALKKFVVQGDVTLTTAATGYTVTVSPALIWGNANAFQNAKLVGVSDTDDLTVTAFGVASTSYGQDIAMHKDAFCFATADLVDVSQYGAKGAREQMDGISMRFAQQYSISADTVPARFDILWGFAPLYPELAVRHFYAL